MLRVATVLRSTEIQPLGFDWINLFICIYGPLPLGFDWKNLHSVPMFLRCAGQTNGASSFALPWRAGNGETLYGDAGVRTYEALQKGLR